MNRWVAWAARLAARRGRRPVRRPVAPLVLLRLWRPVPGGRRHTFSANIRVVTRAVLLTGPARSAVVPLRAVRIRPVGLTVRGTRTTTVLTPHRTARERHAGSPLTRRDGVRFTAPLRHDSTRSTAPQRRHTRVERPAREWRGQVGSPGTHAPVPAGPVVAVRQAVPSGRPQQAVPGPMVTGALRQAVPEAEPRVTEARAPALDLERIADDVLRRIDRRIVAHRERLGRI
ncbi:hypothetical protein [Nonomuraea jiangxiensis]|uniref:Uncharacterized protein n=1 Tax=Nonomuraea jiangxiensis TaxID=633440 RepID=A0A1G9EWY6_9ACTN|nr:hypothetical protein [Nonomuraea jiangxiensis]SDK80620.1 hypothetical protein SAMN05421869_11945 [Nonomuraea jiangxiensis]